MIKPLRHKLLVVLCAMLAAALASVARVSLADSTPVAPPDFSTSPYSSNSPYANSPANASNGSDIVNPRDDAGARDQVRPRDIPVPAGDRAPTPTGADLPSVNGPDAAGPDANAPDIASPPAPAASHWPAFMIWGAVALLAAAALIGPMVRIKMPQELPPTHSHDEPPGASHHHGRTGLRPGEVRRRLP